MPASPPRIVLTPKRDIVQAADPAVNLPPIRLNPPAARAVPAPRIQASVPIEPVQVVVPPVRIQPVAPIVVPAPTVARFQGDDARSRVATRSLISRPPVDPVSTSPSGGSGRWHAAQRETLEQVLQDWAERSGWTVVSNSKMTYTLQASADFQGSFIEAASALIKSIHANPRPRAVFYEGNKALELTNDADQSN